MTRPHKLTTQTGNWSFSPFSTEIIEEAMLDVLLRQTPKIVAVWQSKLQSISDGL